MTSAVVEERHPTLYFSDGDIVLRAAKAASAEDGGKHYQLFRVQRSLLQYHSATFRHMFADANVGPDETYDGVPMADMHGDRAEDLGLLLNYIYNPFELNFKRFDPDTPVVLGGVIRIADKYLVEPLRDLLVKQVPTDWPTTLEEWDRFEAETTDIQENTDFYPFWPKRADKGFCDLIPEPVSAILFAQEFDCPQILPAAFYQLSRIDFARDWSDTKARHQLPTVPFARWSLLDKENLVRCLHGFQKLNNYPLSGFDLLSEECCPQWVLSSAGAVEHHKATSPCCVFLNQVVLLAWDKRRGTMKRDPLRLLLDCLDYKQFPELSRERFPKGLCDHCVEALPGIISYRRRKLWEALPSYFMLG